MPDQMKKMQLVYKGKPPHKDPPFFWPCNLTGHPLEDFEYEIDELEVGQETDVGDDYVVIRLE